MYRDSAAAGWAWISRARPSSTRPAGAVLQEDAGLARHFLVGMAAELHHLPEPLFHLFWTHAALEGGEGDQGLEHDVPGVVRQPGFEERIEKGGPAVKTGRPGDARPHLRVGGRWRGAP